MTHQNRSHQGWGWLLSWMGLTTTPPTLLALVLLAGWTPEAAAQITNTLSPLEIYEGERLTFTFDTSDTTARANMRVFTAIPFHNQTATYSTDYLLYAVGSETATTGRTDNGGWEIPGLSLNNSGQLQFDVSALTDSDSSESDETIEVFVEDGDNYYGFSHRFTVTLKDGARPSSGDGVTISPTSLALTELGTSSTVEKTYTVVLDTDPTANVTVTVANGDSTAVAVDTDSGTTGDQSTLTFTAGGDGSGSGAGNGNWATAQTVTVRALNDGDALAESFNLTHSATATGSTAPYHNITIDPVAITTTDAGHGVVVSESSLSVAENDETATYTVVLKSQPSGNVQITTTSGATGTATASPATLTFGSSTWNSPQTVTVTGKGAGSTSISHAVATSADTTNYPTSTTITPVAVTVTADARPAVTVTPRALTVSEGEDDPRTAGTQQRPVRFRLRAPNSLGSQVQVSYGLSQTGSFVASLPASENIDLYPAPLNSSESSPFAVTDDSTDEPNGTVTATLSEGTAYRIGSPGTATVRLIDNDPTTVTLAGGGTVAEDGSDSADVTVTLGRKLVAGETVTVPLAITGTGIAAGDYTIVRAPGSSLNRGVTLNTSNPHSAAQPAVVFTGHDTNTVQVATLRVTAVQDNTDEGASEALAVGFGSGSRAVMSNLDRASGTGPGGTTPSGTATVTITDDDDDTVTLSPTEIYEGERLTFTFETTDTTARDNMSVFAGNVRQTASSSTDYRLYEVGSETATTVIRNNVWVIEGLSLSNSGQLQFDIAALTDSDNSESDETIIVFVEDDDDDYSFPSYRFTITLKDGARPATDGVTISPTSLALTELGASSAMEKTYTVVLDTDPTANVTVTVANGDATAVAVDTDSGTNGDQSTLTFTAGGDGSGSGAGNGNWATAQTVTVRALNDADALAENFNLTHSATATGSTAPYDGITIDPVAITTTDAGHGVVVSESSLSVAENDETATYTVVLKSQPSGNVAITTTSGATGTATASPATLTFTNSTWNAPQTVTVTGKGAGSTSISHAVETSADTTNYPMTTTIPAVAVMVTADTRPTVSLSPFLINVNEGENAEFTLTLSAALGADVTIPVTVIEPDDVDVVASGDDYTAPDPSSATITAGETEATFTIATTDDEAVESAELLQVAIDTGNLPASVRAGMATSGTIIILNNDEGVPVSMSAANASVREGESLEVFFELAEALDKDVQIPIVVFGDETDITDPVDTENAADYTVTIAEGATTGSVTVTTLQDALVEGRETFSVSLPSSGDARDLLWGQGLEIDSDADTTRVVILDDDLVTLTESSGSTVVNEDGTTDSYVARLYQLSGGSFIPSTVVATAGDGVQVSASGNTPAASRSMNLHFQNQTGTVHVHGVDDDLDNPGGSRSGRITHAVTRTSVGTSNGVVDDILVTITDDDPTTVTLSAAAGNIEEGETKEFTITLGRGLVDGEVLTAPLTFGGTATRGTDYTMTGAAATGVQYNNLDSGNATVVFTGPQSGATATTATITLSATSDSVAETTPETVDIAFGTITNTGLTGAGGVSDTDSLAEFNISDAGPDPGVTVSTNSLALTELGTSITIAKTYTVVLDTDPTADVTVTATVPAANQSDVRIAKSGGGSFGNTATLTFTAGGDGSGSGDGNGNWAVAQTVTVRALNDGDATSEPSFNLTHSATAASGPYDEIAIDPVAVTVTDAGHGVVVSKSSVSVVENDQTVTYTVALKSQPTGNVVIAATSGATTTAEVDTDTTTDGNQGALTFTNANWNTPQTVTVTGKGAGSTTISHAVSTSADTTNYPISTTIPSVSVTVTAVAEVSLPYIAPTEFYEGETVTFKIFLSPEQAMRWNDNPDYRQIVGFEGTATVGNDGDFVSPSAGGVFGRQTAIQEGDNYTLSLTLRSLTDNDNTEGDETIILIIEAGYVGGTSDYYEYERLTITLKDGARPAAADRVIVSRTSLTLTELGSPADVEKTYTVVLSSDPGADVTITLSNINTVASQVDTDSTMSGDQRTLTFTAGGDGSGSGQGNGNWAVAQTVTVRALNDGNAATENPNILHSASAASGPYNGIMIDPVRLTLTDAGHGVVVSESSLSVAENDETATYTVALKSRPSGNVEITTTSGATTTATASPATLTFNASNWNTPQTVTVTGKGTGSTSISHAVATSADTTNYPTSMTIPAVTVTVTATSPGLTITETGIPRETRIAEPSGIDTYLVRLKTAPLHSVTVTPTSSDTAVATVSGTLTFTTSNWTTFQTVTVTAVDDNVDNLRGGRDVTITHPASSTDPNYTIANAGNVEVRVTDNEPTPTTISGEPAGDIYEGQTKEITIELNRGLVNGEIATMELVFSGTATKGTDYTLTNTAAAGVGVTYDLSRDSPIVAFTGPESGVTATTASITLTAIEDNTVENNPESVIIVTRGYTSQLDNGGVSITRNLRNFNILEVIPPGLTFSKSTLTVSEDGTTTTDTYTVVLATQPTHGVTVTASAGTGVQVAAPGGTAGGAATLTFTTSNWSTPQTVTVTGVDDSTDNPGGSRDVSITHAASSTDPSYTIANADNVEVTVTDDDATTVTLAAAAGDIQEGQTKEFTITLNRGLVDGEVLTAPLTFGGTATRGTDYTMTGAIATGVEYNNLNSGNATVVFTGPQSGATATTATITLSATADSTVESVAETVDIGLGAITNTGLTGAGGVSETDSLAPFNILNPGVTVSTNALALTELGSSSTVEKTYTVVLDTDPGADVTITVTNGDATAVSVDTDTGSSGNQTTLTFTAGGDGSGSGAGNGNWAVPQTVTVRALNDADTVGEIFNITHAATAASGPYNGITVAPVAVTMTDADHGVVVSKSSVSVAENDETETYTVVLKSEPGGPVTISATSGVPTTATVSPVSVSFTDSDWNEPKTFTVTGKDMGSTSISHGVTTGTTAYPTSTTISGVTVTVTADPRQVLDLSTASSPANEGTAATLGIAATGASADQTVAGGTALLTFSGEGIVSSDYSVAAQNNFSLTGGPPPAGTATVNLAADSTDEPNETLVVGWQNLPSGYRAGTTASILIIDQDPTTVTLGGGGTVAEDGSNSADVTVTLSRNLVAGETVTVPLAITGAGITAGDYAIAPAPGSSLNSGVTLTTNSPHSASEPAVVFTGHGTNTVRVATLRVTAVQDTTDEGASEALTVGFGSGNRAVTSNLDLVSGTGPGGTTTAGTATVTITDDDIPVITISGGSAVTEGTGASFTVNANPAPAANLEVTVAVTQSGDFVASSNRGAKTVTIDANATSKVYTVPTVGDMIDEANGSVTVTVNSGEGYTVGSTAAATVTVNDDDTAAVTIVESGGSTSVSEAAGAGRTDSYTVALATQPTHSVTITPTSSDTGAATVSSALTFTTSNWSAPQTVTVTGVDDNVDNPGGVREVSISHGASSTDPNYRSAGSVEATVTDDDATTVTLSAAAGDIQEGQTKEFTITLGRGLVDGEVLTAPLTFTGTATRGTDYTMTGAVATGVQYNNLDSGNATVVFTGPQSGATATTAPITLSATSDSVTETTPETVDIAFGTITNTGLTGAGGVSETDNLSAFNISDAGPGAGVTVSTNSLALTELGAANLVEKTYTIVLDTDPGAGVTITVTNGDATAVSVDTDTGSSGNQTTLTFTSGGDGSGSGTGNGNWAVPQTVTVRALNDADTVGETFNITHVATAASGPYDGITVAPVAVTITDAGHGVVVSKSSVSVAENDETETYTVVLKSEPGGPVTISATSGATTTATVSPVSVSFTDSDWNTPKTFTVTGKGMGSTSISHAVTTATTAYPTSTTINGVTVTVTADARPEVTVTPKAVTVSEGEDDPGTDGTQQRPVRFVISGPSSLSSNLSVSYGLSQTGSFVASLPAGGNTNLSAPPFNTSDTDAYAVTDDSTDEPNGTVTATLSEGTDYRIGSPGTATVTLIDNDPTTVTLAGGGTVMEDGSDSADITVTLSRNLVAGETVTVPLAITGAGIAGSDYTIVRAPGSNLNSGVTLNTSTPHSVSQPAVVFTGHGTNTVQVATLRVTAVQDTTDEGSSETLTVGFGSGNREVTSNLDRVDPSTTGPEGTTTAGTATVTITDDDTSALPVLSVELPSAEGLSRNTADQLVFQEANTEASFNVTLAPSPSADFTACIRVTETGGDRVASANEGIKVVTVPSTGTLVHTITWTDTAADDRDSVVTVEAVAPNTVGCSAANGTYTVSSTDASDTALILDDDPTTVELTSSDTQMREGDASNTATLTFRLGRRLHGGEVVVVPFTLTTTTGARLPGNATPDFTVSATGTEVSITGANTATPRLTFTGHETNTVQTATVTLTPVANRNDGDTAREEITATLAPDSVLGSTSGTGTTVGGGAIRHGTNYAVDLTLEEPLPVITISGGVAVTEGTGASFTVNANPAPAANLDVTVAVTQSGDFVTSSNRGAKTVTIDANVASKTYTVATVGDMIDEANGSVTVTVNNGEGYTVGSTAAATVTVEDDDTAAVTIVESGGATSVSEAAGAGRTDTYTVVLATQPTHGVTVTASAGTGVQVAAPGGTAGGAATLTFTTSNWSTPQTVTVTGVDENVDNPGGSRDVSISHAASSTDPNYAIGSAGNVEVTVTDDDATTVTLAAAAGDIQEGQTKEFTITLGRGLVDGEVLTAPLTFGGTATRGTDYTMTGAAATGVQYNNLNSGSATVVFTGPQSGATATMAPLTLSATSDSVTETTPETVDIAFGTITNTGLTGAGGVSETDSLAPFNISDAGPGAGVTVSTNALALTELGSSSTVEKTYTVVLDTDPGADVTITVTNGDATAVSVDTDTDTTGNQTTLTFTAGGDGSGSGAGNGNWAVPQTVTVRALNDVDSANETFNITHVATAASGPYDGIAVAAVAVTTTDAGHGVVVSKSNVSVAENEETVTYTVVLKSQPGGTVTISATSGVPTTATVSPTSVTFTNSDWNEPKTFTVTGKDVGSTSISHAVTTDTTAYPTSTTIPAVSVTVTADPRQVLDLSTASSPANEGTAATLGIAATGASADQTVAGGTALLTFSGEGILSSDYSVAAQNNFSLTGGPPPAGTATVNLAADSTDEPNETLVVGWQNLPSGYRAGTTASILIIDQDPTTVTLAGGGTVAEDGSNSADVTVTLSRNLVAGETVTVPLAITGAGITAGDYAIVRAPGSSLNSGVTLNTNSPHSASEPAVVFTGHGTNTVQVATLRVTAVQDTTDEGASEALTVGFGSGNRAVTSNLDLVSGTGPGGTTTAGTATVTVEDDDTAAVTIVESGGATSVSEAAGAGRTDSYTVVLATQPTADVTITPTSSDTGAATVSGTLTFTPSNWSTPQTVTVTGVDDNVDQTGNRSATISHSATSSDGNYNGITIASVTATVVDNDGAGLSITETGTPEETRVTESAGSGNTDTYTVVLETQPTHEVTVTASAGTGVQVEAPGGTAGGTATLTFTTSNWSTPQMVTVTGVDDSTDNPGGSRDVTISHAASSTDPNYTIGSAGNVEVTVTDDDATTVTLAGGGTVAEDGSDSSDVTVTLGRNLVAGETVTVPLAITGTGVTAGDYTIVRAPGSSLNTGVTLNTNSPHSASEPAVVFTGHGTNTVQVATLRVTAVQDATDEGSSEVLTVGFGSGNRAVTSNLDRVSGTGPGGTTTAGTATVTITDDDNDDDATLSVITISGGVAVTEGAGASFTVNANPAPAANLEVTVAVTQSGDFVASSNRGAKTVTIAANATSKVYTVPTENDMVDEANGSVTVTVTVNNGEGYTVGSTAAATVTVEDDDTAAVTIVESGGTSVTEAAGAGRTDSYTVALATRPTHDVTITPTSSDTGAATVSPGILTFTASNWSTPQTVTVTGVDDSTVNPDGGRDVSISHAASSTDPSYTIGSAGNVEVRVTDDDATSPNVITTVLNNAMEASISAGGAITEGENGRFTLAVTPAPAEGSNINVNVMISDRGGFARSGETGSRSVTVDDSGTATVIVKTEDDAAFQEEDGIITASVIRGTGYRPHSRRGSASIRVRDNDDIPGLLLSPERLTVEQGGSNVYTVTLDEQPGAEVTVSISIREPEGVELRLDPAVFTFSPRDWERPQPVRVTAPETAELVGRDITLLHRVSMGAHEGSTAYVVVEVVAADPLRLKAWHLRFGRTVSQQVVGALQDRFAAPPTTGLELTVAGEAISSPPALAENDRVLSKALGFENLTGEELLEGSSFSFSPEGEAGAPQLAFWGQGSLSSFSGQEEEVSLDGDVTTLLVGADWSTGRWQAGAALSRSWGNVSYDGDDNAEGEISTTLTGLFPYGRYALTPRLNLWATAGYGWGDLSLSPDGNEEEYEPDITMTMVALGMDGLLLDGGSEGVSLTTTADLLSLKSTSDEVERLESSEGKVSRFRLGLEATRPFPLANGSSLLPSLEMGIRQDNGDAETGFGMDLGAGVTWEDPQRGISAELRGRTLLSHAEEEFQDQGLAVSFSWDPSPSNRGPSLSVSHAMGATATAEMDALFNPATFEQMDGATSNGQQFAAELAYGFPVHNDRLTLTPAMAMAFTPTSRNYGLLWSLAPYAEQREADPWQFSIEAERQEHSSLSTPTDHSLKLRFSSLF